MRGPDAVRFQKYYIPEPNTGCWLWTGSARNGKYGGFSVGGKKRLAHRVAWELAHGPIPDGHNYHGTVVMHRCDNPWCVNPGHLRLGTQAENVADRDAKGRAARLCGERHGNSVLSDDVVRAVRTARAEEGQSYKRIAARYGISKSTVAGIIKRRSWRHI